MDSSISGVFSIRSRIPQDDEALLAIENRATELFRVHGYPSVADTPLANVSDFRAMMDGHETWVAIDAAGRPVGYAVAGQRDRYFHLRELAVDPPYQRKGLGSALLDTVVAVAEKGRYAG